MGINRVVGWDGGEEWYFPARSNKLGGKLHKSFNGRRGATSVAPPLIRSLMSENPREDIKTPVIHKDVEIRHLLFNIPSNSKHQQYSEGRP